jgi:hypothetical protein
MSGYREDNFDLGEEPEVRAAKSRRGWIVFLFALVWIGPSILLMDQDGYPDSFGIHYHSRTGRGQTFEQFVDSYVLLQRHHVLDVITFAWIWAPLVGAIGWVVYGLLHSPKTPELPGYSKRGDLQR